ncbi:MAG TPA: endonuclease/exonuclease/phosphatase family protein [Gemmatimonadales bacterium]|nr:endonuclease/exonuclease/phosphatase family protein [Gemmatimonadales bacterium]
MHTHRFALASMLLALVAGCSDSTSPGPGIADEATINASKEGEVGAARLVLMTQNLFVGADVDAVLLALSSSDPSDDFPALIGAIQTLQRTSFPTRAAALADRIARERPHAIGLQEVSRIEIVLPPFGLDFQIEFLPILLDALADRGLDYEVAAQVLNIDANPTPGIRLVDYDVLLVDADRVTVNSASGQNFTLNVGPFAPGVSLIRGWVQANVTIGGSAYTIVSTHPEPDLGGFSLEQLRAAQIGEIVATLGSAAPAVIMGDLNDQPGTLMYQVLTGAGFTDVWAELRPGVVGLTCCHETDLSDKLPAFDEQVDYVFARGFAHANRDVLGRITRFGMLPSDRFAGPLGTIWVSDHAGLLATLLLPAGPQH